MNNRSTQLDKLMGLGERSVRKSYYPELQKKIRTLERFNLILNRSHDILLMTGCRNGRIVDCNLTACHKLGYPRDVLLGLFLDQVFSAKIRDAVLGMHGSEKNEELETSGELFLSTHDSIPVEVNVQRIRHENQEYMVFVAQDISKRVQAQNDTHRLEQQLMQSQKMEIIGTFAGGIAHDFNNLLQIIAGNVQLLSRDTSLAGESNRNVRAIEEAATKAGKLVKRLLTISRKVESSKQLLGLNELIRETIALSERLIPRMILLELELEPDIPPVFADPVQLEQIILNLAGNAFDALGQTGKILIRTSRVVFTEKDAEHYLGLAQGAYIRFIFSDNGPGMTPEVKEKIFDPFFTTKEVGKGTGLGLSTVYAIVKEHGGYMTCYSSPDQGTSFTIYFPVALGQKFTAVGADEKEMIQAFVLHKRILIIDDEEMIAEISREMLEEAGCRVMTANSGEEGTAVFLKEHPQIDLVLLDLGMPGMGGEKCLHSLRSIDPEGLFVVASGYLGHDIAKNPSAYGAAAFLEKPFRSGALFATLARVFEERSVRVEGLTEHHCG